MSKVFFYHGIYKYIGQMHSECYCRKTGNVLKIPDKFMEALTKAFWIHVKKKKFVDKLEFTLAHDRDLHIATISIVHSKDYFAKKSGYKIASDRMIWSKTQPPRISNEMWWSCDFE